MMQQNSLNNQLQHTFTNLIPTISMIITNIVNYIIINDKPFTIRDFLRILNPNITTILSILLPLLPMLIISISNFNFQINKRFNKSEQNINNKNFNEWRSLYSCYNLVTFTKYKSYDKYMILSNLKNIYTFNGDFQEKLVLLFDLYYYYINSYHFLQNDMNSKNFYEQHKQRVNSKYYKICNNIVLSLYLDYEVDNNGMGEYKAKITIHIFANFMIKIEDLIQLLSLEILNLETNINNQYPNDIKNLLIKANINSSNSLYKCYNEHIPHIISIVEKYKKFLNGNGRYISCNFCFSGTYGTAKTYTACAIAKELNRKIIELNLHTLRFETELFDFVLNQNDYTKCVYLIDEVDMICPDRSDCIEIEKYKQKMILKSIFSKEQQEEKNGAEINKTNILNNPITLRSLLSLISGGTTPQELVIIATTNHPEKLDPALIRAGRLKLLEFKNLRKIDATNMLLEVFSEEEVIDILQKYEDYTISGSLMSYFISCCNTAEELKSLLLEELEIVLNNKFS